jgi:hypothetical protein
MPQEYRSERAFQGRSVVPSAIDFIHGRTVTITPSEPLLSETAAPCLNGNWPSAIRILTDELLSPGLFVPGHGGELLARILFTMAQDVAADDSEATMVAYEGPPYSAPIKLCDFLNRLFGGSPDNLPSKFPMAFKYTRVSFSISSTQIGGSMESTRDRAAAQTAGFECCLPIGCESTAGIFNHCLPRRSRGAF